MVVLIMKKIFLIVSLFIAFGSLFLQQNLYAKVYKWVDSQGKIQYSSNPPKNQRTKEIKITPFNQEKARRKRKTYAQIKADKAEDKEIAEKKAKGDNNDPKVIAAKRKNLAIKKRNCAVAQRKLRQTQQAFKNRLLVKRDAEGNVQLMDTNDVERRKRAAAALVQRYCR